MAQPPTVSPHTQDEPERDFMVGEFHVQLTLDDSETVRLNFPESLAMPTASANNTIIIPE
jgi:hypothetical protein